MGWSESRAAMRPRIERESERAQKRIEGYGGGYGTGGRGWSKMPPTLLFPGEGRGPVLSRIWTPAFAGEQGVRMIECGYVYILADHRNGTLYIGVTSDLPKRIYEHRIGAVPGFTRRYGCKMLVWYQAFDDLQAARHRELQMKEWRRAWKLRLIEEMNPDWNDLYDSLF